MKKICVRPDGNYICDFIYKDEIVYTSEAYASSQQALDEVNEWISWSSDLPFRNTDSIYYIVEVPETWFGPYDDRNLFSGLRIKIGRSNNVLKRVSNLQTGSSGELIICAVEPGHSKKETSLHKQFKRERRQGEWFICTLKIFEHIEKVAIKNNIIPPEHALKLETLMERAEIYSAARKVFGGSPDIVNPSLDEPWHGKVLLDLVNGPNKCR